MVDEDYKMTKGQADALVGFAHYFGMNVPEFTQKILYPAVTEALKDLYGVQDV
jgi:hypothetical protein